MAPKSWEMAERNEKGYFSGKVNLKELFKRKVTRSRHNQIVYFKPKHSGDSALIRSDEICFVTWTVTVSRWSGQWPAAISARFFADAFHILRLQKKEKIQLATARSHYGSHPFRVNCPQNRRSRTPDVFTGSSRGSSLNKFSSSDDRLNIYLRSE